MTQKHTYIQTKNTSFNSMATDDKQEQPKSGCSATTNRTMCRSTCSIILSADLYPNVNEPEKAYGTYNTTASCMLSPDTVSHYISVYKHKT